MRRSKTMSKRMKKFFGAAMATVMMFAMSATAFAAGSPVASGTVNTVTKAVDKNGNAVNVKIQAMPEEYKAVAEEIKNVDNVKKVLGDAFVEGMSVVDVQDVVVDGEATFPLTITFKVPGVVSGTKVAVLHYDTEKSAWEVVESKAGDGTITATFNSLSPVAFVVDKNTAPGAKDGAKASPKTGEGMAVPFVATAAVILLIGAAVCFRKREVR
jgi:hypothetical protein